MDFRFLIDCTSRAYCTAEPEVHLTNTQLDVMLIIYAIDAFAMVCLLTLCFYIVLKYVCCPSEKIMGFIYMFYSFAVILCSLRLTQSLMVEINLANMLKENKPDQLTPVNILNTLSNTLTFLFGCVIVYNTFALQ